MGAFREDWLTLREPCDHAARSSSLAGRFAGAIGPAPRLVDLACGTGSNVRCLAPRMPPEQRWLCLDHDRALLAGAAVACADWAKRRGLVLRGAPWRLDLRGDGLRLEIALLERDLRDLRCAFSLERIDGITASALLDLVSAAWIDALAMRLQAAGLPALFALTIDGRLDWRPEDESDRLMRARLHAHQKTDKGFGPALGPDATSRLAERLQGAGFEVSIAPSTWRLDAADAALLHGYLAGVAQALREVADDAAFRGWLARRRRQLAAGTLTVEVGHQDLLSIPG